MIEKLMQIGFTKNEAIVFEALVHYGEISASELSKKVSIDRSVTYNILDNLVLKGFVSHISKNGKKRFFVKKAESLLIPLQEKLFIATDLMKTVEEKQKILAQVTDVSIHEGKDALKILDSEWIKAKKIYALNVVGKADQLIPYHMAQIRHKAHKKTEAKVIVSSAEGKEAMKLYGIKPKVIPKKYWNNVPVVIHEDIVLITTFEKDKPLSIRIQNKNIADAFRKDFELIWELIK